MTEAHDQSISHKYVVHYPEHEPRTSDPHYSDFQAYKKRRKNDGSYTCDFATDYRKGDTSECDLSKPLECHHKVIEFSLANSVDLSLLEAVYPGVSTKGIGAWIETAENLQLLCIFHHRGHAGVHVVAHSDYEAELFVRKLIG